MGRLGGILIRSERCEIWRRPFRAQLADGGVCITESISFMSFCSMICWRKLPQNDSGDATRSESRGFMLY